MTTKKKKVAKKKVLKVIKSVDIYVDIHYKIPVGSHQSWGISTTTDDEGSFDLTAPCGTSVSLGRKELDVLLKHLPSILKELDEKQVKVRMALK